MISKFIPAFLIFVFSIYINTNLFSYLLFKANQEKIIASCCEKKVIDCNARCFLSKSFDKNEKEKEATGENENLRVNLNSVLYCETNETNTILFNNREIVFQHSLFNTLTGHSVTEDHPPKI